jgi:glycerol uptake facilitator-like aquaporin
VAAEATGTFLLFATVIGSGIMAEQLSGGSAGLALACNAIATGAMLYVLVALFGPVSGAHFNPLVTLVMRLRGSIGTGQALAHVAAQLAGGLAGVFAAHLMFDLDILQLSTRDRSGLGQWTGEAIATFGLILTVIAPRPGRSHEVPASVALYITAAYWFTSSTSFANPAITLARGLTDTFAGIAPASIPGFILAQLLGAGVALLVAGLVFGREPIAPARTR